MKYSWALTLNFSIGTRLLSQILKKSYESKLNFKHIDLEVGDIIIFSNKCPHRSKKNKSNKNRKTLYYTYTISKSKNLYKKYFLDKVSSKNKNSKSLTGEI